MTGIAKPPTDPGNDQKTPPRLTDADKNLTPAQKVEKLLGLPNDPNKPDDMKRHQDLEGFLSNMKLLGQNEDGDKLMFEGKSGAKMQVGPGGVGIDIEGDPFSPANIEAAIEMSLMAKRSFGNTLIEPLAGTPDEQHMMREIAKRVGLNVGDTSRDLPIRNPEVQAKLDETWEKVKDKYNLPSMNPVAAAAPQAPAPIIPPPALGMGAPAPGGMS